MRMPQVRFTVRQMMIIPVFVAIATSTWVTVDRLRWGRYRARLDHEMKWSRDSVGDFLLPLKESRSPTGRLVVEPEPKRHRPNCVLKISYLVGPDREGQYYEQRWSLGGGGEWCHHALTPLGRKGGQNTLGPHKLAEVRRILSACSLRIAPRLRVRGSCSSASTRGVNGLRASTTKDLHPARSKAYSGPSRFQSVDSGDGTWP